MENIAVGISTTIVGMLIVFAVLCLLAFILSFFKNFSGEKPTEAASPTPVPTTHNEPEIAPPSTAGCEDSAELVAVLAAAVAASLNTQADKLVVRSFRKVSNWSGTAKRESMKEDFF